MLATNSTPGGLHNRLKKGVRKLISSSTIWVIRNSLPSENQESNDDEDYTFQ